MNVNRDNHLERRGCNFELGRLAHNKYCYESICSKTSSIAYQRFGAALAVTYPRQRAPARETESARQSLIKKAHCGQNSDIPGGRREGARRSVEKEKGKLTEPVYSR
jgi:hypothetical protein